MKTKFYVPALTFVIMLSVVILGPVGLASAQLQDLTITSENCTVTVSFFAGEAGTYIVEFWDDGELKAEPSQTIMTGEQTLVFSYTFTEIGDVAPGIGIYIYLGDTSLEVVDPYTDIDETCTPEALAVGGCDTAISLAGAVVGRFLHSAEAYWAPDFSKKTTPTIEIPWNTTLWTFGVDESGEFRKVLLNCTFLWVPADTMGPNYDEVWQGAPLPTTVVE